MANWELRVRCTRAQATAKETNMNGFIAILAILGFLGGLIMMGYAFSTPGAEMLMFGGGIALSSLAIGLPIHLLEKFD